MITRARIAAGVGAIVALYALANAQIPSMGTPHGLNMMGATTAAATAAPTATPASTPTPATFEFTASSAGTNLSQSANSFLPLSGAQAPAATEANANQIVDHSATIKSITCRTSGSPGTDANFSITVQKNATPVSTPCVIIGPATSCTATANVAATPGTDVLDYKVSPSAATTPTPLAVQAQCAASYTVP